MPAHRHGWPSLTIFVCGRYVEHFDSAEVTIAGPAVVVHGGRRDHANLIGPDGLETISLQFDPAMLRAWGWSSAIDETRVCNGGNMGRAASRLAQRLVTGGEQLDCRAALAGFLQRVFSAAGEQRQPVWMPQLHLALEEGIDSTALLATLLGLHPAWLARAYAAATGESIQETVRRRRVEKALGLCRTTSLGLAEIAAEAGS